LARARVMNDCEWFEAGLLAGVLEMVVARAVGPTDVSVGGQDEYRDNLPKMQS